MLAKYKKVERVEADELSTFVGKKMRGWLCFVFVGEGQEIHDSEAGIGTRIEAVP